MKVYVIRREDGLGGAEGAARRLCSFLAQHHDVERINAGVGPGGHDFGGQHGPGWWKGLDFAQRTNAFLKAQGPHLSISLERGVHSHIYRAGDGVHRRFMATKYKNPLARLINPLSHTLPRLEASTLARVERVIANSTMVRDDLLKEYPNLDLQERIDVVLNGFDPRRFHPNAQARFQDRKKRFIFMGHDWKRKGLVQALEILRDFSQSHPDQDFELLVLGKGQPNTIQPLLRAWKLEKKVCFLGAVTNVAPHLQRSDVMLFPTQYDPFSNASLEALACGCALVTTPYNGAAEVIEQGKNGMLLGGESRQLLNFLAQDHNPLSIASSVAKLTGSDEADQLKRIVERLCITIYNRHIP